MMKYHIRHIKKVILHSIYTINLYIYITIQILNYNIIIEASINNMIKMKRYN